MHKIKNIPHFMLLFILFSLMTGCSGGTGSNSNLILGEGRFLDSAVSGLRYSSGDQYGITDINGRFIYEEGKTIEFFIGDFLVGETSGKPIITPVDLVPNGSVSHPKVINICRLLLTLDADGDPNNGIEIPADPNTSCQDKSLNFNPPHSVFEDSILQTLVEQLAGKEHLISAERAQNHLQKTLDILKHGLDPLLIGTWIGTGEGTHDVSGQIIHFDSTGHFYLGNKGTTFFSPSGRYDTDYSTIPYSIDMSYHKLLIWDGYSPCNTLHGVYQIDGDILRVNWETCKGLENDLPDKNHIWMKLSATVDFTDYLPVDPNQYGLKIFNDTYGGSGQYMSIIEGTETVPYLSGDKTGAKIGNFSDANSVIVHNNGINVTFLGFDRYFLSNDLSLTDSAQGWSLSYIYDGMVVDQGTYFWIDHESFDHEEGGHQWLLIDIQDVNVSHGRYKKAVIIWQIDLNDPFTPLDFHGMESDLSIALPTSLDTKGCSITGFDIYGYQRGPIASGDICPLTGSLKYLSELRSILPINWMLLEENLLDYPQMITSRCTPEIMQDEMNSLIVSHNVFAFDLYHKLKKDQTNFAFSPYPISMVLAMTYAGAMKETAKEIYDALRLNIDPGNVHEVFNAVNHVLDPRKKPGDIDSVSPALRTEASAWGQTGYPVLMDFFNILASNYCDTIQALDFKSSKDDSEGTIEAWIEAQTEGSIRNALTSVTDRVRLAFTAIAALDAEWAQPFDPNATFDGHFELLSESVITVPMMTRTGWFPFTEEEGYQAVELPFKDSNLAMLIMMPTSGNYNQFENDLDDGKVQQIKENLALREIQLYLPQFSMASEKGLLTALSGLGLKEAQKENHADFSGANSIDHLYMNGCRYKSDISVAESGIQAAGSAAATLEGDEEIVLPDLGVLGCYCVNYEASWDISYIGEWQPEEIPEVILARPFIFVIHEKTTRSILFLGFVKNPNA